MDNSLNIFFISEVRDRALGILSSFDPNTTLLSNPESIFMPSGDDTGFPTKPSEPDPKSRDGFVSMFSGCVRIDFDLLVDRVYFSDVDIVDERLRDRYMSMVDDAEREVSAYTDIMEPDESVRSYLECCPIPFRAEIVLLDTGMLVARMGFRKLGSDDLNPSFEWIAEKELKVSGGVPSSDVKAFLGEVETMFSGEVTL